MENGFDKLFKINVNDRTEKKGDLTYLSWAWAWAEFKKVYPRATYTIKSFDGKPYIKEDGAGYMVFTTVTADDLTLEMWLPVMDNKNKAMIEPTMTDINKAIMRCLTKNLAMFGLGLYIYAGEDLPEEDTVTEEQKKEMKELGIDFANVIRWAKISDIDKLPRVKAELLINEKKKQVGNDNNVK